MRRPLIMAVTAALLLAFVPAAVSAAPAARVDEHAVIVDCFLSNDEGQVGAFAVDSSIEGGFGELGFWAAPNTPPADPDLVSVGADVSSTDTSLSADYSLIDLASGDPAGTAELRVDLTPDGPPSPVSDQFREGNRWVRVEGTVQPVLVSGTLTIDGVEPFDAGAGCLGEIRDLTIFTTNPSAFVDRFDSMSLSCIWETADGAVGLFANGDRFGAGAELFVSDASGDYAGFAEVTLTSRAFDGTWDLFAEGEETPVGDASASATLASTGETFRTKDGSPPSFAIFVTTFFSVDGSLDVSTPGGDQTLPMNGEFCSATHERTFFHDVRPAGPKPGPLANDAPEGAIAATFGKRIRIVTGGNAAAPEEPCTVADPETNETFEIPFGFTAWWTFVGTGGPVTVDTAGSNFDTVLAVYTGSPGSFTQIACVDDVFDPAFSLQSRVTIDTVAGVTYSVQAGGFGGSTGRLQLVVRTGT
jgi:hypothetical protein